MLVVIEWNQNNELFSLFLDDTMTYSCAIFEVFLSFYSLKKFLLIIISFFSSYSAPDV